MPDPSKNLYQRMSAVMQDVKRLQKDKSVGSGNYAYKAMSEEKVTTTLRNAMIEHGLVIFPVEQHHAMVDYCRSSRNGDTVISLSTVDVKYKLVNIDNPAEFEIIASSGTGVDPQDKGVGKAQTYAMKYALMRAFLIPTGEDPDDVHNEDLARQQQAHAAPRAVAAEAPYDEVAIPVKYATAAQKEAIIELLNHPVITREEKTKFLLGINRLDEDRADKAITKLNSAINERSLENAA